MERLPVPLRIAIDDELRADEHVHWVDQPPGTHSLGPSFVGSAIGLIWIFLSDGGARDQVAGGQWAVALLLRLAELVGIWLLLSPLWQWRRNRRTAYVITDQRAFVIQAARVVTVESFAGHAFDGIIRRTGKGGRGDLIFSRIVSRGRKGSVHFEEVGFFGVQNVREVESLLPRLAQFESVIDIPDA